MDSIPNGRFYGIEVRAASLQEAKIDKTTKFDSLALLWSVQLADGDESRPLHYSNLHFPFEVRSYHFSEEAVYAYRSGDLHQ